MNIINKLKSFFVRRESNEKPLLIQDPIDKFKKQLEEAHHHAVVFGYNDLMCIFKPYYDAIDKSFDEHDPRRSERQKIITSMLNCYMDGCMSAISEREVYLIKETVLRMSYIIMNDITKEKK